jgi:hypothetical protein
VSLASPLLEDEWTWEFGDGVTSNTAIATHTFDKPGEYRVSGRWRGRMLFGLVHVAG